MKIISATFLFALSTTSALADRRTPAGGPAPWNVTPPSVLLYDSYPASPEDVLPQGATYAKGEFFAYKNSAEKTPDEIALQKATAVEENEHNGCVLDARRSLNTIVQSARFQRICESLYGSDQPGDDFPITNRVTRSCTASLELRHSDGQKFVPVLAISAAFNGTRLNVDNPNNPGERVPATYNLKSYLVKKSAAPDTIGELVHDQKCKVTEADLEHLEQYSRQEADLRQCRSMYRSEINLTDRIREQIAGFQFDEDHLESVGLKKEQIEYLSRIVVKAGDKRDTYALANLDSKFGSYKECNRALSLVVGDRKTYWSAAKQLSRRHKAPDLDPAVFLRGEDWLPAQ